MTKKNWLPRVLIADDEAAQRTILKEILRAAGHEVETFATLESALAGFERAAKEGTPFELVLTDLKMPGGTEGLDLLAKVKEASPQAEVILMTAYGQVQSAVSAMKRGAFEYLEKPFDRDRLLRVVGQATEKLGLVLEVRRLRDLVAQSSAGGGRMIGRSAPMQRLFDAIARVAQTATTCLIRGESGTGKELVARAIHFGGARSQQPFVAINCAAIPETLIESELFGHEKGVFTGATSAKSGRFEEVGEGTLFLDEIGSMKYDLQAKLLRVIQEREFSRLGSSKLLAFRGRIVAATAQDLEQAIAENRFREDLYFRLNVVPLEIPPLRERIEDVPLLVEHILRVRGEALGRNVCGVTPGVLEAFEAYSWPGNVRELENCIERMLVLGDGERLTEVALPPQIRSAPRARAAAGGAAADAGAGASAAGASGVAGAAGASGERADEHARAGANGSFTLPAKGVVMEELEAELIRQALERSEGRIEPASQLLGITYKTLQYRIKKYTLRTAQEAARHEEQ